MDQSDSTTITLSVLAHLADDSNILIEIGDSNGIPSLLSTQNVDRGMFIFSLNIQSHIDFVENSSFSDSNPGRSFRWSETTS
jgi:hypothetical protein